MQLDIDGQPTLRFAGGRLGLEPHAKILENFLDLLGIDYEQIPHDPYPPALEGERYKVLGAGDATVWREQKRALFYRDSESITYLIKINPGHLEDIRRLHPDWNIEEI